MVPVNVDNFARAETARMLDNTLALTGGVNRWFHYREPTPVEQQPVIRMNRDTLCSGAIVDMADGAQLTLPDAGNRYMSVMLINEDHYLNRVLIGAGTYQLDQQQYDQPLQLVRPQQCDRKTRRAKASHAQPRPRTR